MFSAADGFTVAGGNIVIVGNIISYDVKLVVDAGASAGRLKTAGSFSGDALPLVSSLVGAPNCGGVVEGGGKMLLMATKDIAEGEQLWVRGCALKA